MQPTVQLVSGTSDPIETVFMLWEASRKEKLPATLTMDWLKTCRARVRFYGDKTPSHLPASHHEDWQASIKLGKEIDRLFSQVIHDGIPIAENISFTFILNDVSIALREQLVRHRIGVKVGANYGVDTVPDLADSTWWSQSMRIMDMGAFAQEGKYLLPDGLKGKYVPPQMIVPPSQDAEEIYKDAMTNAQIAYKRLLLAGVPMEDARNVIPLAATHRISWTLNLAALQHIIGKRGCWILQLGLWKPIIVGMVNELSEKVDPVFRDLICPPCIKGNKFVGCHFIEDNERRIDGKDNLPPCALYVNKLLFSEDREKQDRAILANNNIVAREQNPLYQSMASEYSKLWGRDIQTGLKNGV